MPTSMNGRRIFIPGAEPPALFTAVALGDVQDDRELARSIGRRQRFQRLQRTVTLQRERIQKLEELVKKLQGAIDFKALHEDWKQRKGVR